MSDIFLLYSCNMTFQSCILNAMHEVNKHKKDNRFKLLLLFRFMFLWVVSGLIIKNPRSSPQSLPKHWTVSSAARDVHLYLFWFRFSPQRRGTTKFFTILHPTKRERCKRHKTRWNWELVRFAILNMSPYAFCPHGDWTQVKLKWIPKPRSIDFTQISNRTAWFEKLRRHSTRKVPLTHNSPISNSCQRYPAPLLLGMPLVYSPRGGKRKWLQQVKYKHCLLESLNMTYANTIANKTGTPEHVRFQMELAK